MSSKEGPFSEECQEWLKRRNEEKEDYEKVNTKIFILCICGGGI